MRALLELLRLPLTPTAPADSLTGCFLALSASSVGGGDGATAPALGEWVGLGALSISLYWAGMASNDLLDAARDRVRSPQRPLARGAVSRRAAAGLVAGLLAAAAALAWWLGLLVPAGVLAAAVLAYNAGGKHVPFLGSGLMGSCRALNLVLGATLACDGAMDGALRLPAVQAAASVLGLYVATVTSISLLEDRPYRRRPLRSLVAVLLLFPAGLAAWGYRCPGAWVNAVLLAVWLARLARLPPESPPPPPDRHPAARVVGGGLAGLYFIDAGFLWAAGSPGPAAGVSSLFVLGWFWRRRSLESPAPTESGVA